MDVSELQRKLQVVAISKGKAPKKKGIGSSISVTILLFSLTSVTKTEYVCLNRPENVFIKGLLWWPLLSGLSTAKAKPIASDSEELLSRQQTKGTSTQKVKEDVNIFAR